LTGPTQAVSGIVVNGTQQNRPLGRAAVVLRAGDADALFPVAETTTDEQGRFTFADVPIDAEVVFQAGANHENIHYPGPRFRLDGRSPRPLEITVFDAVAAPSPLRAKSHEIDLVAKPELLEVTETIVVVNPSRTTFVGAAGAGFATTLSLAIPEAFERVTFHREFFGRRFHVVGSRLVTDVPWTPGERTLKFTYYVPMTESRYVFGRPLDLSTAAVRVRVRGTNANGVSCNLPACAPAVSELVEFESADPTMAAGRRIEVRLGHLPAPWFVYGRWAAVAALCLLVAGTIAVRGRSGRLKHTQDNRSSGRRPGRRTSDRPADSYKTPRPAA
jgi:hypothetical protein